MHFFISLIDFYCILNMYSVVWFISVREWRQMFLNLVLFCIRKKQTNGSNFMFEAEGTDCFCVADVPFT